MTRIEGHVDLDPLPRLTDFMQNAWANLEVYSSWECPEEATQIDYDSCIKPATIDLGLKMIKDLKIWQCYLCSKSITLEITFANKQDVYAKLSTGNNLYTYSIWSACKLSNLDQYHKSFMGQISIKQFYARSASKW